MTISPPAALLGSQRPRVSSVPNYATSAGLDAVDLAAAAGLQLDPWQKHVLVESLGEKPDGRWSAFEVGLIVPRQNGKGSVLEARELAGLFLFGDRLILHSAHEFKTASEAFQRVLFLVQNTPELDAQVTKVYTAHGQEGIELKNGSRLRFVARSKGSGRGFSADLVILDEAYELDGRAVGALLPTMAARPNPQLWYASSAGMRHSQHLASVRERGLRGDSESLAYFEWSADPDADMDDRAAWAAANPALGIRIFEEFVAKERDAMDDPEFARERLGIWDDPSKGGVFDPATWADRKVEPQDFTDVALAVDVTPDRASAAISAGGRLADRSVMVDVVDHRGGMSWVLPRLVELAQKHGVAVIVDPASPAGSLIPALEESGIEVRTCGTRDYAQACGAFYDRVIDGTLHHLGQMSLDTAITGARKRPLGDGAFGWNRRFGIDISPLVAATLAMWGVREDEGDGVILW